MMKHGKTKSSALFIHIHHDINNILVFVGVGIREQLVVHTYFCIFTRKTCMFNIKMPSY